MMEILKLIISISCLFHIYLSIDIHKILFKNQIEIPLLINKRQTYEIIFENPKDIPDKIKISLNSLNNLKQIISFSSTDKFCHNSPKFSPLKGEFYLEKSQLSLLNNFFCIQCENPFQDCRLKMKLSKVRSNKENIYNDINEDIVLQSSPIFENQNNVNSPNDINTKIYTLSSIYKKYIEIPSEFNTSYQIDSFSKGSFEIVSGDCITIDTNGIINPKSIIWYIYEGDGGQYETNIKDPEKEIIKNFTNYTLGTAIIKATINETSFNIIIHVEDYASFYVKYNIDEFMNETINIQKTTLDKFKNIIEYIIYFGDGSFLWKEENYETLIITNNGNIKSRYELINIFCDKINIKCREREAKNDEDFLGHNNVIALIDKKFYVANIRERIEMGDRWYVNDTNIGYSYKNKENEIIIYQYDGNEEDITIPSSIDDKTVIGLDKECFSNGIKYSGIDIKSIIIPETVIYIGDLVFYNIKNLKQITIPKKVQEIGMGIVSNCTNLEKININKENTQFIIDNSILYDKNKSRLIAYPIGKKEDKIDYLSTNLERIEGYSFYYAPYIETILIPESVKYIGERAFGYSNLKRIYFKGDPPLECDNIFEGLEIDIYFPINNNKWDNQTCNFGSYSTSYIPYDYNSNDSAYLITILVISCIVVIIAFIVIYLYCIKKKGIKSKNVDFSRADSLAEIQ